MSQVSIQIIGGTTKVIRKLVELEQSMFGLRIVLTAEGNRHAHTGMSLSELVEWQLINEDWSIVGTDEFPHWEDGQIALTNQATKDSDGNIFYIGRLYRWDRGAVPLPWLIAASGSAKLTRMEREDHSPVIDPDDLVEHDERWDAQQ